MVHPDSEPSALAHLALVQSVAAFRKAPVQSRVLDAMVRASVEGRVLSGRDLALAAYGRDDEQYLRAIRQVVREVRFKLLRHYAANPSPIRFQIAESGYEVHIVSDAPADPPAAPPAEAPAPGRPLLLRPVVYVGAAMALLLAAIALKPALHGRDSGGLGRPATIVDDGRRPIVLDEEGRPLPGLSEALERYTRWSKPATVPEGYDQLFRGVVRRRPGTRDVLVLVACDPNRFRTCRLIVARASDGAPLDELQVPLLPDGTPLTCEVHERQGDTLLPDFRVWTLDLAELDGDGLRDEILVSLVHYGSFPVQVLGLDWDPARGFTVLLDYWIMGHSVAVRIPDANGDGVDEVAALGTFNGNNGSFLAILPKAERAGARPGRSPESVRPAVVREIEHLPERGLFLVFPASALADPTSTNLFWLRGYARRMDWLPDPGEIRVLAEDKAKSSVSGNMLQVEFALPTDGGGSRARIATYDAYLTELITHVTAGRIADRWGILERQDLSRFASDLAGRIQMWDEADPAPGWRPYDPAALAARFGTPETRRRSAPVEALMAY